MNLAKEVLEHERIHTTHAKARAVRPELEKLITLGKRGDLSARRQALSALGQDKFAVHRLFVDVAPRYADRPGGYTRILKVDLQARRRRRHGPDRARLSHTTASRASVRRPQAGSSRRGMLRRWSAKLTLEYDGARFAGWAAQPGQRTVQGVLERALATLLGQRGNAGAPLALSVAGRTDRGVHAWGQVASYRGAAARRARAERAPAGGRLRARGGACRRGLRRAPRRAQPGPTATACSRVARASVFAREHALWWPHAVDHDALAACALGSSWASTTSRRSRRRRPSTCASSATCSTAHWRSASRAR